MTAAASDEVTPQTLEALLAECEDTYARVQRLVMRLNNRAGTLQSLLEPPGAPDE